jgi:hypothetical protein
VVAGMTWQARFLDYATLAVLVAAALIVAFCLDDAPSIRVRLWALGSRWTSAADETASTKTLEGRTVTVTSTRAAAVQMLRDSIGEM